jgi:hypothetical protein
VLAHVQRVEVEVEVDVGVGVELRLRLRLRSYICITPLMFENQYISHTTPVGVLWFVPVYVGFQVASGA